MMYLQKMLAASLALVMGGFQAQKSVYDYKETDIDGKPVQMSKFKGKVMLIVNTASKCGYTPQYAGLQKLYTENKDKGFVIIGFPANNFKQQEPGTNAEIKEFCTSNYDVTFPMMSKISVVGDDQEPLYKFLIENSDYPNKPIEWNFEKFLIDRSGQVRFRFSPAEKPDSKMIAKHIAELLAEKAPKR
jgi:glutathione peroxidase